MQSKIVQCVTPQELKAEVDAIIAATPAVAYLHVVELSSARTHFVIIWK